jgi:hypothetical protein
MKLKNLLVIASVAALLIGPRLADSCGVVPMPDLWFTTYHGALAGEFESGHLGVLRPHYWRRDLLLSYRTLSGVPWSAGESAARSAETSPSSSRTEAWTMARQEVPGLPAVAPIDPDRKVPRVDFQYYANCLSNAFESAATTLRKRVAEWGSASPKVSDWVRGQDLVFVNCSAGPAIPEEISSLDPLLTADRNYQIAAAHLYAEQYAEAETGFDRIASDANSPWQGIAPYLAARACIRRSTIGGDSAGLRRAAERLRAILADPAQTHLHTSAEGLLEFVLARLEPRERLVELGNQLMQPNLGSQLGRVLTDYTSIWDREDAKTLDPAAETSDVLNWIATFQRGGNPIERWRSKGTLPWLVAALAWPPAPNDPATDMIAAARAVKSDSPAYASVSYYGILQQIRRGERDAALRWTDEALTQKLPDSAINLLRAERLYLARDWTEFLRFAPRKPLFYGSSTGDEMRLADIAGNTMSVAFDADAAWPFNTMVPLKLWIEATRSTLVPPSLQAKLAQTAWVRAVILRDQAAARVLAERVRQLNPELAAEMRAYLAESDPAAANFKAVFLMLRTPIGLEPVVRSDTGQSGFSPDHWWALTRDYRFTVSQFPGELDDRDHAALSDLYPTGHPGPASFLGKEQRSAGEEEWNRLFQRAANSVGFLCSETLSWARAHPNDPLVPQALHLAVGATRFGLRDERSPRYSKQAFDLLHRVYPRSVWTARTKYWY